MDDKKTSKYPRALARNETRDNRNFQLSNVADLAPEIAQKANKRALTEFNKGYPYIFDGLSFLCTWYATAQYQTANGETKDVIARKNDPTETHYRTILPIKQFIKMCLGDNLELTNDLLLQLCKLAGNEEKKVLTLNDDYSIYTTPIRIDFVTKNGDKVTDAEKRNINNLHKRFENTDHYKQDNYNTRQAPIEYVIIEYYKPLFSSLLEKNKKGTIGYDYFQVPAHFQANLNTTLKALVSNHFFDNTELDRANVPMTSIDARLIFEVIADHDNGLGNEITIPALELARRCFPQYLNRYTTKDGEQKENLPKSRGYDIRIKIKKAIVAFKQMGTMGKMDGGRFIPVELVETSVYYDVHNEQFKIKVLRPANKAFPKYTENDIKPFGIGYKPTY